MINETEVINILGKGLQNIQERQGFLSLQDVEAEVINQACKYIIQNFSNQVNAVHDINKIGTVIMGNMKFQPIALVFVDAASTIFPNEYGEKERTAAFQCIYSNISWAGMWDFLRDYFQKKHGVQIDNVKSEPMIFYSQRHTRFERGIQVSESVVERNVNINFFNGQSEIIVSIEPTLSAKKAYLFSNSNNILVYNGADPDYRFTLKLDKFDEVEEFILELPNRALKLCYY